MMVKIISALFATIFIAILFQVRKEHVLLTALGGGLGSLINELAGPRAQLVLRRLSRFDRLAAYSEIMARVRKTTVTTFLISALFPLVPGAGMYYTMLGIVNNELDQALTMGVTTLSTAALMALGILFVSTLARLLFRPRILPKNR